MSNMRVKICGLTRPADAVHAVKAGAAYIGLVFFPPSPRSVTAKQAREVLGAVPETVTRVALLVDPEDALVDEIAALPIDLVQLHGHESPGRVREVKTRTSRPVMKAIGLRDKADLAELDRYEDVADRILVDAKPPTGATRPGGNALAFDWKLIADRKWRVPWMLAGGLTPENVAEAVRLTGARELDVSSSVESSKGVKDPAKVSAFVSAATGAMACTGS